MGSYGILYCQKVGLVDSWYIRLYASFYLKGKLTLYPGKPMVENGGLDGSGTHCRKAEHNTNIVHPEVVPIQIQDIEVSENAYARKCIACTFKRNIPHRNFYSYWENNF